MRDLGPNLPPLIVLTVLLLSVGALVLWIMTGSAGAFGGPENGLL